MSGRDLLEAMGHVEERYVDEAEYKTLRKSVPLGWISAAACLCILIGGAMLWIQPQTTNDCAVMENYAGSNMEMDGVMEETNAAVSDSISDAAEKTDGANGTEAVAPMVEEPSVALRIDAWNADGITATVCDRVSDADVLPLGQEVTVLFDEQIRTNTEWRKPTEEDFPVGSYVVVIYHSYQEDDGGVCIVMTAIMDAEMEETE